MMMLTAAQASTLAHVLRLFTWPPHEASSELWNPNVELEPDHDCTVRVWVRDAAYHAGLPDEDDYEDILPPFYITDDGRMFTWDDEKADRVPGYNGDELAVVPRPHTRSDGARYTATFVVLPVTADALH